MLFIEIYLLLVILQMRNYELQLFEYQTCRCCSLLLDNVTPDDSSSWSQRSSTDVIFSGVLENLGSAVGVYLHLVLEQES